MEYEDEESAVEAKQKLNDSMLGGLRLNIEWSKSSGKNNAESHRRRNDRSRSRSRDGGRHRKRE